MSWYAANAILYFRLKASEQRGYWVWENVYLIEAHSFEDAQNKAAARARQAEGDSGGSLTIDGQPAELVFLGIRKVTQCENDEDPPGDGSEVTYSELQVDDWASLERLARGQPTPLTYEVRDYSDGGGQDENGSESSNPNPI